MYHHSRENHLRVRLSLSALVPRLSGRVKCQKNLSWLKMRAIPLLLWSILYCSAGSNTSLLTKSETQTTHVNSRARSAQSQSAMGACCFRRAGHWRTVSVKKANCWLTTPWPIFSSHPRPFAMMLPPASPGFSDIGQQPGPGLSSSSKRTPYQR